MHRKYYILYLLLLVCAFTACTPRSIREAQSIVAQADSLRAKGCMYSDSAELAQAYEKLGQWQWFYADEYAHACYHYGRLLREKDNPVEGMQVFINATNSRTDDYHILGRVYSNMGDLCHKAGEFDMSYELFAKSADMFLRNKDTTKYYYALIDMAFELAEQGQKEETLSMLDEIIKQCPDESIIAKNWEARAELYLKCKQFDSTIYFAREIKDSPQSFLISHMQMAQAFSYIGEKDSAICYANIVLSYTNELYFINSALYILTHCDESKDKQAIRTISADRSDVQKLIEIRRSKLAVAVQLLKEDLQRTPDKRWILPLVSFILFILIIISLVFIWRKRKLHQYIIQDIRAKEKINSQLSSNINNLTKLQEVHHNEIYADIEKACLLLQSSQDINDLLHWRDYNKMIESVDRYLYNITKHLQSYNLSEKETRLCILVLLKASTEQMVDMIPYAHSGIGKFKYATARKLGTTSPQMRTFLLNLLV